MRALHATMHRASWPADPRDLVALILLAVLGLTISLGACLQLDADAAEFILMYLQ